MSSYAYGEPVTLTLTAADGTTADLADYAEVVLTIVQPDGTNVVKSKTAATLTANPYVFTPAQSGRHVYYYVTTTPTGASDAQPFDVLAAGEAPLVSLADVKSHLNITSAADDDELRGFIAAATDVIENIVGAVVPRPVSRTVTPYYDEGKWKVILPDPVSDLSALTVTEWNGTTSQAITYEPLDTDPFTAYGFTADDDGESGIIYRTSSGSPSCWAGTVRVSYTAGRSAVPAAIRMAALLLIEHSWEQTQRGGADLPLGQFPEGVPDVSYGPDKRSQAMQYLAPYRKAPAVA